ncbi:MAG TPA: hypothetical protein VJU59_38405 [Paraburkholderia sp.]|uniref:hypothetical protein n=1 Tax=Paraburkholderia sp. TaxID=1926495 RepID=UPI002B488116|nr:hypothetical protein [Paraburkholderia sp.]HKR45482.1 hypothetical protein [Paraburkholderia sp.]
MTNQTTRDARASDQAGQTSTSAGWRDALICAALIVGFVLLLTGLVRNHMWAQAHGQLADGLLTNICLLAVTCAVVGAAALVWRRWARHLLVGAFSAALVVAFGWSALLWVAVAFISFAILGEKVLGAATTGASAGAGSLSLRASVGAALYVLVLGLLVHYRVNTPTVYGVLLFLPWLWRSALGDVLRSCRRVAQTLPCVSVAEIAAATLLLFIFALHLTGAGLPERYADGVLYHVVLAQTVARLGYWPADFHLLVWALMPAGTDWLFSLANMMAGEPGAKAMSFLIFLLLTGNLYSASRRVGVRAAGAMLVVALFASTPLAFIETAALFVEHGLALFMFAALAALLATGHMPQRRVLACVLLLAAAIASKLHAFAIAGPLGLVALWVVLMQVRGRARVMTIALGVVALVAGCEPYIYAYAATHNPVFPFFNAVFRSPYYPLSNFVDTRWVQPPPYDLFYHLTFHTERSGEFRNGAFGFQLLALTLGAVAAACFVSMRALAALVLGLAYVFAVSKGSTYARYLYPGVPLLMVGVASLLASDRTLARHVPHVTLRRLAGVGMLVLIALNLVFFSTAGWPLAQNFWGGLFNAQQWRATRGAALGQLDMNVRVSGDGLPAPRELLFSDAVPAGLDGTALTVNWYNSALVQRFVDARSVADIARIIRDYGATHASFRLEPNGYGYDPQLVARALEQLGDPIARRGSLILYRLHPDVWLGSELLVQGALVPDRHVWQASGTVAWVAGGGATLGAGASLQQASPVPLRADYLYRLTVKMRCASAEENVHVAIVLDNPASAATRFDDFPPCDVTGDVTRTFDFVTPGYAATAHVIVDNASAVFVGASLREGYPVAQ